MGLIEIFYKKIKESKSKILLLIIMYTVLFIAILLLFVLNSAIKNQSKFINQYVENEVSILPTGKPIYEDTVKEIAKADCVKEYNVYSMYDVRLKECVPLIPDKKLYNQAMEERKERAKLFGNEFDVRNYPDVRLVETNSSENLVFFLNKGYSLEKGRHIQEKDRNVALISEEFAKKNNLDIGDTFKTTSTNDDGYYSKLLDMALKVIGIYKHNDYSFNGKPEQYNSNYIFTSIGPVSLSYIANFEKMTVFLKDGTSIETLKNEISEKSFYLDVENYSFTSNREWAEVISTPFKKMQNMSSMLLVLMIISFIVIIFLIGSFYIRGNLYEIGVLLSVGKSRRNVIFHMIVEECIPLLLGAIFAILIGVGCVDKMAEVIDQRYVEELDEIIEQKNEELTQGMGGSADTLQELRTVGKTIRMQTDFNINYSITWNTCIIFVILIVILTGCFYIQLYYKVKHFSIKEILLSRR